MRHAPRFDPMLKFEHGVVGDIVVAHQRARPSLEECRGVPRCPADTEVEDHPGLGFEAAAGIGPQVRSFGLARAGVQHRHRRLVGMQHFAAEHEGPVRVEQRL